MWNGKHRKRELWAKYVRGEEKKGEGQWRRACPTLDNTLNTSCRTELNFRVGLIRTGALRCAHFSHQIHAKLKFYATALSLGNGTPKPQNPKTRASWNCLPLFIILSNDHEKTQEKHRCQIYLRFTSMSATMSNSMSDNFFCRPPCRPPCWLPCPSPCRSPCPPPCRPPQCRLDALRGLRDADRMEIRNYNLRTTTTDLTYQGRCWRCIACASKKRQS